MKATLDARTEVLASSMHDIGVAARHAARALALLPSETKRRALKAAAAAVAGASDHILAANNQDIELARKNGATPAFIDRLQLSAKSIDAMAQGVAAVADIQDPIASEAEWTRPNGLKIARVRVPIGVVGIIYESR